MNKEKLLEWLRKELREQEAAKERAGFGTDYWEHHEGASDHLAAVIKEIEKGTFDE